MELLRIEFDNGDELHINNQPKVIQKVQSHFQGTSQLFITSNISILQETKHLNGEAMESLCRHNPCFIEIQMLMHAFQTLLKVLTPCANFSWRYLLCN